MFTRRYPSRRPGLPHMVHNVINIQFSQFFQIEFCNVQRIPKGIIRVIAH